EISRVTFMYGVSDPQCKPRQAALCLAPERCTKKEELAAMAPLTAVGLSRIPKIRKRFSATSCSKLKRGQLVVDELEPRLILVPDIELDRARWLVRKVLIAVNSTARNVDAVADLERSRLLAFDGQGDFAFLHCRPLVARMPVELIALARRNGD